jgi:hypothetical protein
MADLPGGASGLVVATTSRSACDPHGAPKAVGPPALRPRPDPRPAGRWHCRCPCGASGLLARHSKGKEADRLVTRIDSGVVSLVAELRGHERPGGRGTGAQGLRRIAGGEGAGPAADRRGTGLVGEECWRWRNREGRTTRWIKCRKPSTCSGAIPEAWAVLPVGRCGGYRLQVPIMRSRQAVFRTLWRSHLRSW